MPSSCGMFVYRDVTSAVTKRALGGRGGSFSMRLRKCFLWFYVLRSCRCVDLGEVVSCIHCADIFTFITWFDDDGLVILEVVQC